MQTAKIFHDHLVIPYEHLPFLMINYQLRSSRSSFLHSTFSVSENWCYSLLTITNKLKLLELQLHGRGENKTIWHWSQMQLGSFHSDNNQPISYVDPECNSFIFGRRCMAMRTIISSKDGQTDGNSSRLINWFIAEGWDAEATKLDFGNEKNDYQTTIATVSIMEESHCFVNTIPGRTNNDYKSDQIVMD